MTPREVYRYETTGKLIQAGSIKTTPKETTWKPSLAGWVLLGILCIVGLMVNLYVENAPVSEDVPYAVPVESAR